MNEVPQNGLEETDVLLLGYRPDVNTLLNASDVLVQSSFSEGAPLCVIESLAVGTPVVATDVGDTRTLLSGFGYLAPPRNPQALALRLVECLSAIKSNSEENQDITRLSLEYAKTKSIEAKPKQYQEIHYALAARCL